MLTGKQPFTGATPIQIAYQHVNSDVPAPSDALSWLPLEVDELVGALAARDPADRPADARAALELLRRTRATLDDATLARRAEVAPSITLPRATADGDEIRPAGRTGEDADEVDVDDESPAGAPDGDPAETDHDATAALDVSDRRAPRHHDEHDDEADGSLRRTMALRIGSGLEPEPEVEAAPVLSPEDRVRRRRIFVVLLVIGLAAVFGSVALWYTSEGPGAYTTVPQDVVGVELAAAQEALAELGLTAAPTEVFDPVVADGLVVAAEPGEGERVRKEGTVALSVSKGPDLRTVPPDLVGAPAADVIAALTAAGFVVPEPERAHHDTVPADSVIGVSAEAGAQLPVDSEVRLTVSDGPEPLTVPSVIGTPRDAAVRDLENVGLKVVEEKADFSDQYPAGVVMAQSPEPGTAGHRMDGVSITISQGPPLVEVPDLFGKQYNEARTILESLGLVAARENVLGGLFGTVRDQSVPAGQTAPKGSTVTLKVV
jgi:serine/threonine-protein kinase